jgi:hypothetical protein
MIYYCAILGLGLMGQDQGSSVAAAQYDAYGLRAQR